MFHKVLVANRGEIAVRIIRACKLLGVKTVAIYSEADKPSLHVRLADESFCVGPPPAGKSYLNVANIISAALISGADAIHPGYGFLSESTQFAEICETHHIRFIGPSAETMATLGDKARARALAEKLGIPVIPGTPALKSLDEALKAGGGIGYPIMIKAAAGGGGKGMRLVSTPAELEKNFSLAQGEAEAAFGDGRVYLEKYLVEPRHIEVQILGDSSGQVTAIGERECSLQRKHQKIVEEAPSVVVTQEIRKKLQEMATKIGRGVSYVGAGTIEFLRDSESGKFYFIEANARIQVEHPVTELVTGLDLIREQMRVTSGEKLSVKPDRLEIRGHAIECRVNAEDPETLAPSVGTVEGVCWPGGPGLRVDTHIFSGEKITPFYDNLLAKVVAWGEDRREALNRMTAALQECEISGIRTNLPLLLELLRHPSVKEGKLHVRFVESLLSEKVA